MGKGHQSFTRDGRTWNQTRCYQLHLSNRCLWEGRQVGDSSQSFVRDGRTWNQTRCLQLQLSNQCLWEGRPMGKGHQSFTRDGRTWNQTRHNQLPLSNQCCGKGSKWETAVNLLREMAERRIKPNARSYNSAINLVCTSLLECCVPSSNGTNINGCIHGSYTQNASRHCCDSTCQFLALSQVPGNACRYPDDSAWKRSPKNTWRCCWTIANGKVEHLIQMRERLDIHTQFLESQLAGLEVLIQQKQKSAPQLLYQLPEE